MDSGRGSGQAPKTGSLPTIPDIATRKEFQYRPPASRTRYGVELAKKNPLVPVGLAAVVGAFLAGTRATHKGDSLLANRMMRVRVVAQGVTVVGLLWGVGFANVRDEIMDPNRHNKTSGPKPTYTKRTSRKEGRDATKAMRRKPSGDSEEL